MKDDKADIARKKHISTIFSLLPIHLLIKVKHLFGIFSVSGQSVGNILTKLWQVMSMFTTCTSAIQMNDIVPQWHRSYFITIKSLACAYGMGIDILTPGVTVKQHVYSYIVNMYAL